MEENALPATPDLSTRCRSSNLQPDAAQQLLQLPALVRGHGVVAPSHVLPADEHLRHSPPPRHLGQRGRHGVGVGERVDLDDLGRDVEFGEQAFHFGAVGAVGLGVDDDGVVGVLGADVIGLLLMLLLVVVVVVFSRSGRSWRDEGEREREKERERERVRERVGEPRESPNERRKKISQLP